MDRSGWLAMAKEAAKEAGVAIMEVFNSMDRGLNIKKI